MNIVIRLLSHVNHTCHTCQFRMFSALYVYFQLPAVCTVATTDLTQPSPTPRLYCGNLDSLAGRSGLTTMQHVLDVVRQTMAPVLPHLAEELVLYGRDGGE